MVDLIIAFLYLAGPLVLMIIAFFAGNVISKRHEKDLSLRQHAMAHMPISDISLYETPATSARPPELLSSEVTLGIDHFRGFLGKLKNIFGGDVKSYQSTLDRARREAILRLQEDAHQKGFNALVNLRVAFVDVSGNANMQKKASMVTIQAYATAYQRQE